MLDPSIECKKRLIKSLIMPALTWATGVARRPEQEIKAFRSGIMSVLRTSVTREAPWVVLCATHGWDWDPQFALDWASPRTACRCYCWPPAWLVHVPLQEGILPWTVFVPQASDAVRRCGWGITPDESAVQRRDDDRNIRSFRIGYDNPAILKMWLIEHFKLVGVHSCPRVRTSFHRPDPDLATQTPGGIQNLEPPFCIDLEPLLFSWTRPAQLDPPQCFLVGSTTLFRVVEF